MANIKLSIDTSAIAASIERAIAKKQKVLEDFGQQKVKLTQKDIIAEQSPDGAKFAPLAESTIKRKRKLGYILAILRATDEMLNAFTSEVDGDTVSVTQPKPYGRELQEGRSNMPARPFLGWTDKDKQLLINLFLKAIA